MENGCREPAQHSRLLGRASERALLNGFIDDIRRGESRSLVLTGEPGIGKTALLEYLVEAAPDTTILRASGVQAEMELAYASLHQLCAPILDRISGLPVPQRQALEVVFGVTAGSPPDRFLVGLAALSLLSDASINRPLLCVVDDAQWLDQASVLTLAFVARRLRADPVGMAFATREPGEELEHLSTLAVRGLTNREARALLSSGVGFKLDPQVREQIVAETRGNPLALIELPNGLTATQLAGGFGLLPASGLSGRIEESFVRRLNGLSEDARRLLLLAAAEPVGDPELLVRAARGLGIRPTASAEAAEGLLVIGTRVTFRHPLVRKAVYSSASREQRQTAHLGLAEATDRNIDPDRRAWHMAAAAVGPDEEVACELERSAGRAQARAGFAAAVAFLERAVALSGDPSQRADRALAAAEANLQAGFFDKALALLSTAEAGPFDELQRARADLLRSQVVFTSTRSSRAPALLLRAAQRIEPLDAPLARASYLQALSAAMFAARLAGQGGGVRDVAEVVQTAPPAPAPPNGADLLLEGWAALFANGCAAAAPPLQAALRKFTEDVVAENEFHLLWLVDITAPVVWDCARWDALSSRHVELARSNGALSELPLALNSRSYIHLFRGELDAASALIEEARVAIEVTRASLTPWGAVALAVLRGREQEAASVLDLAAAEATSRGEGISLTVVAWARAILYNGLGAYEKAFAAAQDAIDCPTNSAAAAWGTVELIEAATRTGQPRMAAEAADRFTTIAHAVGTEWALGVNARSLALLRTGALAEQLYREALDRLGRCQMRVDLARTHLLYGEALRRMNRRADARRQLREAYDHFYSIGMEAFAERARHELLATGEKVRKRTAETRDHLTAQERQIAELACEELSNPEIGARLFLSPRTVEWHLRKVFGKLGIRSRFELAGALAKADPDWIQG